LQSTLTDSSHILVTGGILGQWPPNWLRPENIFKHKRNTKILPPKTSVFFRAPAFVVLNSTSGAMNSILQNKSVYLSAKRDLLKVALVPN